MNAIPVTCTRRRRARLARLARLAPLARLARPARLAPPARLARPGWRGWHGWRGRAAGTGVAARPARAAGGLHRDQPAGGHRGGLRRLPRPEPEPRHGRLLQHPERPGRLRALPGGLGLHAYAALSPARPATTAATRGPASAVRAGRPARRAARMAPASLRSRSGGPQRRDRVTDAPGPAVIIQRYGSPDYAIGRAANIQSVAGAFCPAECGSNHEPVRLELVNV